MVYVCGIFIGVGIAVTAVILMLLDAADTASAPEKGLHSFKRELEEQVGTSQFEDPRKRGGKTHG